MEPFRVISDIRFVEIIAAGRSVKTRQMLRQRFGGSAWRKMKGIATVELNDGTIVKAELHWYEAHGVGSRLLKIKRILP